MKKRKECCKVMEYNINTKCTMHSDIFDCPDSILLYSEKQKTYGIIIHDGGRSFVGISYCPWCGKKLK